jgi:hypothetical protein
MTDKFYQTGSQRSPLGSHVGILFGKTCQSWPSVVLLVVSSQIYFIHSRLGLDCRHLFPLFQSKPLPTHYNVSSHAGQVETRLPGTVWSKHTNGPRETSFDLACVRADIVMGWQWFRLKEWEQVSYAIESPPLVPTLSI